MRIIFSIRSLLLALGVLAISAASFAQIDVGVSITIAPPDLPVYEQPVCPGDDSSDRAGHPIAIAPRNLFNCFHPSTNCQLDLLS
jgi:hypothetical protein